METLTLSTDARGVARLVMNRPEVFNAFNELMIAEITAAITACGADPAVRLVVLSGEGKAFSAGADIQWMKRASEATLEDGTEDARRFAGMLHAIASCPKPTVARVHGLALAGGVALAVACDIAVASSEAKFAVSEARLGILPAVIAPYVINAVGLRQAKRLGLTASRIPAAEALAMGLVQEVVETPAELDEAVERWIGELLLCGPAAQAEIKALFAQLEVGPITADVRELSARTIARVRRTPEAREGFNAFLEKRPAAWVPKKDS